MALAPYEAHIRRMVETEGYPILDVQRCLRSYGIQRGTSEANLYKFCMDHNIHRFDYGRKSQDALRADVALAAHHAGPTFGRKMLTGHMRSQGSRIGERLVGRYLPEVNPNFARARRAGTERQINPCPYFAEYPGHKLHLDQNEKLVEYGVTYVCAIDGYSKKILGWSVMPIKNNIVIYDEVYRTIVLREGLPDQVRTDFGKEFYLVLYQQDNVSHMRTNTERAPFVQTQSKQNHVIERVWVEINGRISYPLKHILVDMKNNDEIDMTDEITKYCVSFVTSLCCRNGMEQVVSAWNSHSIPGKGQPNVLYSSLSRAAAVSEQSFPPGNIVADEYATAGGSITQYGVFGEDPLHGRPDPFQQRYTRFNEEFPDMSFLLVQARNGNSGPFHDAILHYLNLTRLLAA